MRANEYLILTDCIERGVALGWNRAHKHVEQPTPETIKTHIERQVTNAICEYFSFDSHAEGPDDPVV